MKSKSKLGLESESKLGLESKSGLEPTIFSEEQIRTWKDQVQHFVMPVLSKQLICLYEISRLSDCIPIRAEKYLSPEHLTEHDNLVKKGEPIPLNIQNPNFTVLKELVESLHTTESEMSMEMAMEKFEEFVRLYVNFQIRDYNYIPDIRQIKHIDLLMTYFRKKYYPQPSLI